MKGVLEILRQSSYLVIRIILSYDLVCARLDALRFTKNDLAIAFLENLRNAVAFYAAGVEANQCLFRQKLHQIPRP